MHTAGIIPGCEPERAMEQSPLWRWGIQSQHSRVSCQRRHILDKAPIAGHQKQHFESHLENKSGTSEQPRFHCATETQHNFYLGLPNMNRKLLLLHQIGNNFAWSCCQGICTSQKKKDMGFLQGHCPYHLTWQASCVQSRLVSGKWHRLAVKTIFILHTEVQLNQNCISHTLVSLTAHFLWLFSHLCIQPYQFTE